MEASAVVVEVTKFLVMSMHFKARFFLSAIVVEEELSCQSEIDALVLLMLRLLSLDH